MPPEHAALVEMTQRLARAEAVDVAAASQVAFATAVAQGFAGAGVDPRSNPARSHRSGEYVTLDDDIRLSGH